MHPSDDSTCRVLEEEPINATLTGERKVTWDWRATIQDARDVAQTAERATYPERHVAKLAKAVGDLCNVIEYLEAQIRTERKD